MIGANGAGKTTLFRMIVGAEEPDRGVLKTGSTVKLAYVDQSRDNLDAAKTVYEEITGGSDTIVVGGRELHGRAYVAGFGFKGSDQQKKVGDLSGGERNRVQLAKVLRDGGNVLLLDEPTNDLDVDTLRALEEGLLSFPGCVVVISHDRWFLDRIATHVLAFEGDSEVRWFEGNFSDYEADRHKRLGLERRPAPPHPVQAPGPGLRAARAAVISARAVRTVTLVVCALGIVGMIVTSILDHNGAAVTFGLVTAVAILCSMVAKAVAAEAEHRLGQSEAAAAPTEALAALVEDQVQAVVAAGADEKTVRQLVGEAVRLGRNLAGARPVDTSPH